MAHIIEFSPVVVIHDTPYEQAALGTLEAFQHAAQKLSCLSSRTISALVWHDEWSHLGHTAVPRWVTPSMSLTEYNALYAVFESAYAYASNAPYCDMESLVALVKHHIIVSPYA